MRPRLEFEYGLARLEAAALQVEKVPAEVVAGIAVARQRLQCTLADLVFVGWTHDGKPFSHEAAAA